MKNFEPQGPLRWTVYNGYYHTLTMTFPAYLLSFQDIQVIILPLRLDTFRGGVDATGNRIPTKIPRPNVNGEGDWLLYAFRQGDEENLLFFRREADTLTDILEMFEQELLPYLRDYARALLEETL